MIHVIALENVMIHVIALEGQSSQGPMSLIRLDLIYQRLDSEVRTRDSPVGERMTSI